MVQSHFDAKPSFVRCPYLTCARCCLIWCCCEAHWKWGGGGRGEPKGWVVGYTLLAAGQVET